MAAPKYRSKAWKKKNAPKGPINPWYQNPDGSAKSEKTQKQQYVQSASQYNSSGTYSPAKTAAGRKRRRASARADLRRSRKRQQRARRTRESSSVADSTVARTSAAFKPSKAPKPPKAAKNWTASQAANWVTGKKPGKPKYQERIDRLQTRIDRTNKQIEKLDSRTRYVPPAVRNTSTVPGVPTGPGGPSGPTVRPGISARQAQANTKRRGNLEKRKDSLVAQRNKLRSLRETVGNQPRKAPKFGATPITKDAKRTQRGAELYTQVKLGQPLRARDFIGRPNIANRVLIQQSKQSWSKAAKDGLPVALGPQNPWRQSRKLAKPNETAAEKFERETEVLNQIMASDNVSPSDDKNVASSALLSAQIKQQAQDAEAAGIDDALVGPAIRGGITSSKAKVERIINADSFGQAVQELSTREMYDPNGDGQSTNAEMLEGIAGAALELTKVKAVTGFGRWGNGIIGRTVAKVRGGRAAGTPLGIRGTAGTVQTEALSTMAPGRAFLNFVKKHPQWAKAPRRVGYGAIGTSAVTNVGGTRDMGLAFLEGTTTADFWKAAPTTLRNVVGMITAPAAIAVNVGVTANRAVDAIGEENDYKRSQEYITAPAQRLAEETWYELQRTVDIMTSKDAERIREATEDDYGYIMAMSGAWLLRTTGKLAVEDSRLAAQYMAKKIANTPAGRAAAKAMWENEWTRGKIENAQLRSKQRKTKKEEKKVSRNTYIAGGRIEGKAGSTTAIMDSRITKPKQKFLSWDRKKSRRNPAYKSVESRIDAFNNRNMAKLKEDDVASDAIQRESVEGIAIYMDSKGMVPGVTTVDEVRTTRNNTPEKGGPEYRRLTLMLELTDLWAKPGSTGFKLFNKMWEEAGNNRKDAEAIRQSRQAQSEAGRRQMESDLEVQRQETLVTAARIEGEDIPLSPRDEQERVLDAERTQRLDKAKFEYELAEKTVDRLFKEYGRTKAELRVLVREREEEIAMAVRGTPVEDQLRSASERVFKVVVNEKYADVKLADVISELKDARGRKDAPEVKRLTELKKKVQQERREAADAKQELRRLEKVAEKMAGKPSARLRKLYAKRQRIQGRLGPELDTAKERRIVLRILKEEEWGQLTAEERLAELLMMEPVQKAAMLELKNHSEALSLLENEQAGVDTQIKLNEAALLMLEKPGGKKRISLNDLEDEIEEFSQQIKEMLLPPNAVPFDDPGYLQANSELKQLMALRDFLQSWDAAGMPRQKLIREINGEQQRLDSEQTRIQHAITVQRAKVAVAMSRKGSEETREEFLTNTIADATQEKLSAQRRAELAVLRDRQEQNVAAAIERNNIVLANYVPHVTETANRISSAMPETNDINSRNDQRRQGELQERGLATRSAEDADAANRRVIEEQKNHDIAMHIASQGILTVDVPQPDGTVVTRSVFHQKELEEGPIPDLFQQQYGYPINVLGYGAPRSGLDAADRMGGILALGGKSTPYRVAVGDEKDDFTTELKDLRNDPKYQETGDNPGHVVSDPVIDGDSFRKFDALSDEILDESEAGTPIVLIRKPMLDLFRQQDKDLEGVAAALYRLNRVSTRMVLGYSFAWMFSQVIAEMLLLVVEHPTRAVPALLKARKFQREGGMAAQQLARLAGSTPGPNPAASSRTRPTAREQQRAVREAARHQQTSPVYLLGGVLPTIKQKAAGVFDVATETVPSRERSSKQQLAADIAWGRQFGRFDRWKSAWIREAGVLANIDKDLSNMARAAKAVRGQVDLIETHADKLSKMTDEEVLLWTDSKEGYEVGMELMKQIDDQMGNWMDLRPGLESAVGQIIFFYPYIRFSLKWAFHTFPKNHPVLYALATTMGAANAEMLERIVNYDPAWPNEWAVVPVFGTPGNAPDYDPTDPEAGELMQNQGSAPTSFWSVSRFNSAGNAATETIMGGQTTDPLYAAVGTITPLASTVIRSAFAIDPYGNKLSDANDAFGESSPSAGARAGQAIDEVLGLIAPTREMQKQSGYSFKDILDGNISLDGAARILKQFENGNLPRRFDDRVGREGGAIEILRSLFTPGLPEDAQVTIDEQKVAKLEGDVREARAAQGGTYNFKGKTRVPSVIPGDKGKMKFLDAAGLVIGARRQANKEAGMNVAARTPYETAIARAYIKQKNEKAEAQAKLEAAQLQLKHFLTDRGYPIDPQSSLGRELFDQKSADKVRAYKDWPEDAPWPGFNKAKRYIDGIEARGSTTGRPGVNAPTASPELTNVTITPGRRKVTTNLRSGTEQRLLAMAKKQGAGNPQAVVNQLGWRSDPTLDPETKVNKKGEVVNYRGAKVLGNMTIDELAKAEQGNDLTRDGDGRILAPRARKLVAAVENASAKVADLRQDVVRQRSKMGGAPALVPQEYKAAIKKWGAWLDKRPDMKSPNDDMVDGLIPKSMSGAEYLAKIIQHESGWNADAYNDTAGATGMGQFIPSTRQGMIDQYGVDPWASGNDAIHAAALYLSEGGGGLVNYNSAYPNSGDNQGTPGTWDGYLNEDVGPMRGNNPKVEAKVKALQQQLQGLSAQQKQAVEAAEKAGIPLDLSIYDENTVRQLDEPTLWKQPTERPKNKPKLEDTPGMSPTWEGASKEILRLGYTISKWIGEPLGVNSLMRQGDSDSDHGSGNGLDINAMAQREGGSAADEKRGDRIAAAAVRASGGTEDQVAELFANGNVTINSPNGYRVQVLWKTDLGGNHFNHVHVGIAAEGEVKRVFSETGLELPYQPSTSSGSYSGGGGSASVSGGGGGMSFGSGSGNPLGFGQGTAATWRDQSLLPPPTSGGGQSYEEGGVDSVVEQIAAASENNPDEPGVKSVAEQVAALPTVRKKKKAPRFPSNPI
jgi:hypothetical protein